MASQAQLQAFAGQYGKEIVVDGRRWRYYRLGAGAPVLWLSGGLRLAARHLVLAPDYAPVQTIGAFLSAFDAIPRAECIQLCALTVR